MPNPIEGYCAAVCVMVRWKRYRAAITDELTAHMEDHADMLISTGADPDEARKTAAAAMGDPYEIGKKLDKLHSPWYPRLTRVFTALAALLLLVSVVIRLNSHTPYPVFAPFADTAELVLDPDVGSAVWDPTQDWLDSRLATGTVSGGGTVGPYSFSGGHAAFYRAPFDGSYYRLDIVVSSLMPWFWLEGCQAPYTMALLRSGSEEFEVGALLRSLPEQGIFRRFYRLTFAWEDPIALDDTFTLELGDGELSYTVRLEGVPTP